MQEKLLDEAVQKLTVDS